MTELWTTIFAVICAAVIAWSWYVISSESALAGLIAVLVILWKINQNSVTDRHNGT